jgi:hypothetical protein
MKTKLYRLVAILLLGSLGVSCTTAYDAYGNPRPVVDPGTAALGAVAAGVIGYSIANSRNDHRHHRGYRYSRYNRHHHHHSGYRYSGYRYPVRHPYHWR